MVMMNKRWFCGIVLGTLLLVASFRASAQNASDDIAIRSIVIEGTQRIEAGTVASYLELTKNSKHSSEAIDTALKRVFATGLFEDVSFAIREGNLVITVAENPIVNEVNFEGNKRIEDADLEKEVKLRPRSVYTKTAVQNDVRRILDVYQKSGRFSAIITPKVIRLDQNRVNLVFEIDEGARTEIRNISFTGNKNFSDRKLREVVQTRETKWWRFFSSDDTFDQDRLNFDQELLRRFYVSRGYADFRVVSATAELTPERDAFFVTFAIEEGAAYNFGRMDVSSQVQDLDTESLRSLILTKEGDVFNSESIEKTIEAMTQKLGNLGYAFVDIDSQFNRDTTNHIIGINYTVKEGPRVYVNRINIHGNGRTLDEVVRREFRLAEGDPYNASKLKRTQQRINNLGFFKTVDIKNVPDAEVPDKVDIDVEVEEKSTGELTLGAGFSTADGPLGDISISERNLLGKGQQIRANFTVSAARQEFDIGFTEPYFMDKNVAAGFDLFKTKLDGSSSRTSRSYDLDSNGGTLRATYSLSEHLSHSVKYTFRSDDISNIDPDASRFIKDREGKTTASIIGHTLMYDTRDSKFEPTEGYYVRLNQDVAGLGGDSKFFRNEVRAGHFWATFNNKWILEVNGKTGNVLGYGGRDVEINNRFFIGGNELRGFENYGLGPRDITTGDGLGGNTYYAGTVEYSFPLGFAEELGFSGAVFSDFGSLFTVDDTGPEVVDEKSLRLSLGAGLSWKSPLGPVRINFANAILKEDFDQTEFVRFSFGTKF
jgi:outer membrane protein insertion porin family